MTTDARLSPLAGKPPPANMLVDLPKLITAYYTERPDPASPAQRVAFGTSGHRGSSFERSFNEAHVLAITQAICGYRKQQGITGPLFLGIDTHALSAPAFASALEVLAANGVEVMIAKGDEYTPTPAISHAILVYNRGRRAGSPTASSSRPRTIRPTTAASSTTPPTADRRIPHDHRLDRGSEANRLLAERLSGVKAHAARRARGVDHARHDYLGAYVADLGNVIDMEVDSRRQTAHGRRSARRRGRALLGGDCRTLRSGSRGRERQVDPTFRFMTRRLGRPDPHGPLLALRHASA